MNIIPDFLPKDHPLPFPEISGPRYVTIHNTANPNPGATAKMHGEYMRSQAAIDRDVAWHFTVDDTEVRQHLPLDVCGWHAGDGWDGPGNCQSIAIEICEVGDIARAEENAAELTAWLLKKFDLAIDAVVQHNKWSRKNCPRLIRARPNGWEEFLARVEAYMTPAVYKGKLIIGDSEYETTIEDDKMSGHLRPLVDELLKMGWSQEWDGANRALILSPPVNVTVTVDGSVVDCNARLENSRTRVDLKPVVQAMTGIVGWSNKTRTADVKTRHIRDPYLTQ